MLPYFLILLIPLVAAFEHEYRPAPRLGGWMLFGVLLVLFSGLRYQVGPDWEGYAQIYENSMNMEFSGILSIPEPGFFLLNKCVALVGLNLQGVMFFSALIFLVGCLAYAQTTANPWLAVAVVMPYLILVVSMSGIRQCIAIGIGMLLFSKWNGIALPWKLALIALAASVHNSAIALALFLILDIQRSLLLRLVAGSLLCVAVIVGLETGLSVERYSGVYVRDNLLSGGAVAHVLLIAFPAAIYLFLYRKLSVQGLTSRNVTIASVATLGLFPLLAVSSTGVDRLTLYFSFVQMWVYPALLRSRAISGPVVLVGTSILTVFIFIVYFYFGTHAFAYIPYRNVLFE